MNTERTKSRGPIAPQPIGWRYGRHLLPLLVLTWAAMIGTGFEAMLIYGNAPGLRDDNVTTWPASTSLELVSNRANLLLFLHPQCPCSVATLHELKKIQLACGDRLSMHIILYRPNEMGASWFDSAIVRQAFNIPDAHLVADQEGELARQFGALTSGHVLVFTADGERIFSGGITPSRAHEGANRGRESIIRYVLDGQLPLEDVEVFGCPIVEKIRSKSATTGGTRSCP